jgi:hypothetical protein
MPHSYKHHWLGSRFPDSGSDQHPGILLNPHPNPGTLLNPDPDSDQELYNKCEKIKVDTN